jgi:uncharacterized membrane protein
MKQLQHNRIVRIALRLGGSLLAAAAFAIIVAGGFDISFGGITVPARLTRNIFRFLALPLCLLLAIWGGQWMPSLKEWTEKRLQSPAVLWGLWIAICAVLIWIKVVQHYTFRTGAFDLSLFDSALSNTLRGRFMYTEWLGRSFFSEHFSPLLLLLLPCYLIYDNPITLMIIQGTAVALSTIPLYHIARVYLPGKLAPVSIVAAYLNYFYLLNGLMFDFHIEIFMPVCILVAFWFLRQRRPVYYGVALVLGLACKEDMPIYFALLGMYACLWEKRWRFGVPTLLASIVWAGLAWKVVIPMSYPDGVQQSHFLLRWAAYGDSYPQIAWGLLTHPTDILSPRLFSHLWSLLRPLAFTPLATLPAFFLSLPALLMNSTSNFEIQRNLGAHYALPILPFVFIASVQGIKNLLTAFPQKRRLILTGICFYLLVMNTHFYPAIVQSFVITPHDAAGHAMLQLLPDDAEIAAQTSLIPHLRDTQSVSLLQEGLRSPSYVAFDTVRYRWPILDEQRYQTLLDSFRNNPDYDVLFAEEGVYLFRRK